MTGSLHRRLFQRNSRTDTQRYDPTSARGAPRVLGPHFEPFPPKIHLGRDLRRLPQLNHPAPLSHSSVAALPYIPP